MGIFSSLLDSVKNNLIGPSDSPIDPALDEQLKKRNVTEVSPVAVQKQLQPNRVVPIQITPTVKTEQPVIKKEEVKSSEPATTSIFKSVLNTAKNYATNLTSPENTTFSPFQAMVKTLVLPKKGTPVTEVIPATIQSLTELKDNPLSIPDTKTVGEYGKKLFDDTIMQIHNTNLKEIENVKKLFTEPGDVSTKIGQGIKTLTGGASVLLAPISALFSAANDVPVLGTLSRIATLPFSIGGDVGRNVFNESLNNLPITDTAKNNLRESVDEAGSLAGQIVVGGYLYGKGTEYLKNKKAQLIEKYGKNTADTIEKIATDKANNTQQTQILDNLKMDTVSTDRALNDIATKVERNQTGNQSLVENGQPTNPVAQEILGLKGQQFDSPGKFYQTIGNILKKNNANTTANIDAVGGTFNDFMMQLSEGPTAEYGYSKVNETGVPKITEPTTVPLIKGGEEIKNIPSGKPVEYPGNENLGVQPEPREKTLGTEELRTKEMTRSLSLLKNQGESEFGKSYIQDYYKDGNVSRGMEETAKEFNPGNIDPAKVTPEKIGMWETFKDNIERAYTWTREMIDDDWVRVKKLITDNNVKFDKEIVDPYEREQLLAGRISARAEKEAEFFNSLDQDLLRISKEINVPDAILNKNVQDYLLAKHAPERNAVHGESAAGITTEVANKLKAEIENLPYFEQVKHLSEELLKFNRRTLDVAKEYQLINEDTYKTLNERYQNHVPLNRIMETDNNLGDVLTGRGYDVRSSGIKFAHGSTKPIADIIENIRANYAQILSRGEKNLLDLRTLKMVRDNPELFGDLFEEIHPKAIGKTFDDNIILQEVRDPNVLVMRENGKPVYLKINDGHLALALKGVNRIKVTGILRMIKAYSTFFSQLQTRFNPEFPLPNKLRDLQEAVVYVSSVPELGAKGAFKFTIKDTQSIKDVTDYIRGKDTEGARLYEQMKMDGGTTGGMSLSTRQQVEKDWAEIQKINRSKPRQAAYKTIELIDKLNTIAEDSTRLSAYRTALDMGLSREKAAVIAKNSSINFNKMGRGGPTINALYMFANASIQGSVKMLRAMKNPKVLGAVATAVGVSVAAVNTYNDQVDPLWRDKVTKWDRLNGLPVIIPDFGVGKEATDQSFRYVVIPVSWGLKPIKVAMDYADDAMTGHVQGFSDTFSGILASFINAYNPVGGTDFTSAVTPSVADLPMDIIRNKSWTGGKLRPDWDQNAPASIQYFPSLKESTTGRFFTTITKGLSDKGIEVSPANVNYAYEQLIGGSGRFASKIINTLGAISAGKAPPVNELPVISRFYRSVSPEQIGASSKDATEVKKILAKEAKETFYIEEDADDIAKKLLSLQNEQAFKSFEELLTTNSALADKVKDAVEDIRLGLTSDERLTKRLKVTNGDRAKWLYQKFNQLKTTEEKSKYWQDLVNKKIITDQVNQQLKWLVSHNGSTK